MWWRPLLLTLAGLSGCASSKYALDDPDYAAKYDRPYPDDRTVKWRRMGKQMVDARHVAGKTGFYFSGAGASEPAGGAAEFGAFGYGPPWLSYHGGLTTLGAAHLDDVYLGANVGTRLQVPARLSPFVGAGVAGGFPLSSDEDKCGCRQIDDGHGFAAVYPEFGTHFWLTGRTRLTASAAYLFNTEGRDADFWLFGLSVSVLNQPSDERHEFTFENPPPASWRAKPAAASEPEPPEDQPSEPLWREPPYCPPSRD